jgi:hypothetical protein
MAEIARLEEPLEAALDSVSVPITSEENDRIVELASNLRLAALEGLEWLDAHPSPNAAVNVAFRNAWTSYETAMVALLQIGSGSGSLPASEYGVQAGAAFVTARKENHEAVTAFVKAIR